MSHATNTKASQSAALQQHPTNHRTLIHMLSLVASIIQCK